MGDYDVPLVDLGLVPTAVMTFAWHPEVAEEVTQQGGTLQILTMTFLGFGNLGVNPGRVLHFGVLWFSTSVLVGI